MQSGMYINNETERKRSRGCILIDFQGHSSYPIASLKKYSNYCYKNTSIGQEEAALVSPARRRADSFTKSFSHIGASGNTELIRQSSRLVSVVLPFTCRLLCKSLESRNDTESGHLCIHKSLFFFPF